MTAWKNPFGGRGRDEALDREIAYHIEALTQAKVRNGMSADEGRHQALIAFGGAEQVKQQLREVHTSVFLNSMAFNLKSAMRFLRRSPSFSAAVILILAVGIGANSAVFSAMQLFYGRYRFRMPISSS
jgi:hypothetical protein